jgi:hypothetical protein
MTIVGLAIFLPMVATAQGESPGHQQIDRLIKRGETTVRQIALTRIQVEETVAAYNALIEGSGDSRDAYRNLNREVDRCDSRLARTRRAGERMEEAAAELFGDWEASIKGISNPDLAEKARGRLEDTRERYDELIALGREARKAFDTFVGNLRDQLKLVGHDLNPDSLETLREYSPTFNEKADELFRKINSTIGTARRLLASMRSP